ncbi:MAG: HAMP domain-containing histidine kinase [Gammaproteobacteria bacterium]|nr:HAMP domain-containing histidine kinase [Gammaproteobacteria bacterium]
MSFDINTLLSAQLHDLKNQMQALLNVQSELNDAIQMDPEQQSLMDKLQRHSNNLSHRLIELLSILKIQNDAFKPSIEEHWLSDTITPLANEFYHLHGLTIESHFDDDFNNFYDEQLLGIALHNACINSLKAGANKVILNVEEFANGSWNLSVSDNGSGFSEDQLNDQNTFDPQGTENGLGLYLIEQALKAHKRNSQTGEITLSNNVDEGALLIMKFP